MKEVEKLDSYEGMQEKVIKLCTYRSEIQRMGILRVLEFMNYYPFYYPLYKMGRKYSRMMLLFTFSMQHSMILAMDLVWIHRTIWILLSMVDP